MSLESVVKNQIKDKITLRIDKRNELLKGHLKELVKYNVRSKINSKSKETPSSHNLRSAADPNAECACVRCNKDLENAKHRYLIP